MTNSSAPEQPAGIGHNNPPKQTTPERLGALHGALIAKLEDVAKQANEQPKEIATDEEALAAAKIAADAGDIRKSIDTARKAENKPLLDQKAENDAFFEPHAERADNIDRGLMKRVTAYNNAVAAKKRAEQAAAEEAQRKLAAEAKAAAEQAISAGRTEDAMTHLQEATAAEQAAESVANAPPTNVADATRIKSASGLTLSTRTEWDFEITDAKAVDLEELRSFIKPEHLEAAVAAFVRINKGTRQIAGVKIFETTKAARRRR